MNRMISFVGFILYGLIPNIKFRFILCPKADLILSQIRIYALKLQGAEIGPGCILRENIFIAYPKNLRIGSNTTISCDSNIYNYELLQIGSNCEFGPSLYVQTNEHKIDNFLLPPAKQGSLSNPIIIGDDIYCGYNVSILRKAYIPNRIVLGACSLVNKELQSNSIYAGVPVRFIRKLDNETK